MLDTRDNSMPLCEAHCVNKKIHIHKSNMPWFWHVCPRIHPGTILTQCSRGGIEAVHPRYAISWRNNWMLKNADYVVTYITHTWGGAAQYARKTKAQGKYIVNIR